MKRLEQDSLLAIEWFQNKCHLLVQNVRAQIKNEIICENNKQKLLGLQIGGNLNFNEYVSSLSKKAGKKLSSCEITKFYEH